MVVIVVAVLGRTIAVEVAVVVMAVVLGMVVIKESVSVPVVDRVESTTLDFIMSGSVRRQRFAGYHPRSLIAFLLVLTLPNDEFHTIFTSGKISPLLNSALIPIRTLYRTNFVFLCTTQFYNCHFVLWNPQLAICVCHLANLCRISTDEEVCLCIAETELEVLSRVR